MSTEKTPRSSLQNSSDVNVCDREETVTEVLLRRPNEWGRPNWDDRPGVASDDSSAHVNTRIDRKWIIDSAVAHTSLFPSPPIEHLVCGGVTSVEWREYRVLHGFLFYAHSQSCEKQLLVSLCLSALPHGTCEILYWGPTLKLTEKFQIWLKSDTRDPGVFITISRTVLLKIKKFQIKVAEKIMLHIS
jgi:hypothetical protein